MGQKQIELIVCQGLPASGKTTWSREWVNEDPKNRVRVNRDDIRNMLGPYWILQREDLVTDIENNMILCALKHEFSVVVDATNLRGTQRFEDLLYYYKEVEIKTQDFTDVPVETCIERDKGREEGHVGKYVIRNMAKKYNLL